MIPLSLFLDWFEVPSGPKEGNFTGWFSFDRSDRVLAVLALGALASGFLAPARRVAAVRIALGLLAGVVVAREMASPPVIDPATQLSGGAYLGLTGAIAVALGGLSGLASVRRRVRAKWRWNTARLSRLAAGLRRFGAATARSRPGRALDWLRGESEPSSGEHAPSPRLGRGLLRGVPSLSPQAFGLFRIALGLGLIRVMTAYDDLSSRATPVASQQGSTWFVDTSWVRWLASSQSGLVVLETVTVVALVFFVAGLGTRLAYSLAAIGLTAAALVIVAINGGAHDWGLPSITALCLLIVPWGSSGLSLDALIRRRRGRSLSDAPSQRYGLAVWIPGLTVGLAFLAAAYAKLAISGLVWITDGAVKYHFVEDAGNATVGWGLRLTSVDEVAVLMSLGAVLVEGIFILVTLSSRPSIRLLFGLMAASVLTGFFLFQGVFWTPWWILLLAFVPWEGLYRASLRLLHSRAPETAAPTRPLPLSGALRVATLGVTVALVAQQVAVSGAQIEEEPILSNFPMYSYTWQSEDEFNQENSKFDVYRYEAKDASGRRVDITPRIEAINGSEALLSAYEASEGGEELDEDEEVDLQRELKALDSVYERTFGQPLERVYVVSERTAGYDFERGAFDNRVVDRTTEVVEPATFEVASADSG